MGEVEATLHGGVALTGLGNGAVEVLASERDIGAELAAEVLFGDQVLGLGDRREADHGGHRGDDDFGFHVINPHVATQTVLADACVP